MAAKPPITCPQCNGKKKITIEVSVMDEHGFHDEPSFRKKCPTCHGIGTVTLADKLAYDAEIAAWCTCETPGETEYVPDSTAMKHHWNCQRCGKLVQVG